MIFEKRGENQAPIAAVQAERPKARVKNRELDLALACVCVSLKLLLLPETSILLQNRCATVLRSLNCKPPVKS